MPIVTVGNDEIDFPDTMSDEQIQKALQSRYGGGEQPGLVESALRGAGQGLTFGFSDELTGAVGAIPALFDDEGVSTRYKRIRDEAREANAAAQRANPKAYLAGEVGAGLTSGLAGASRALAGATLRSAVPRLAAIGAAEGGIAGTGFSDADSAQGIAGDAAIGAATGAVMAPAIPAAGAGIGRLARNAARPFTAQSRAARSLASDLDADNLTPASAQARLDQNPDMILADLGENLQQRLGSIAQQPGPTAQGARDLLENRNVAQLDRLTPKFEKALGGQGVLEASKAVVNRTKEAAKPLYDIAYQTPIRGTARLQELMQRPAAKAGLTKAKRLAADEGVDIEGGKANVQVMDYVQRALRDMEQSVGHRSPNKARIIGNLRKDILDVVDAQVPEFREARRIAADGFADRDALALGGKIFREKTPNLNEAVRDMAESEKEHFRIGVFDAVMDRLGTKVETANLVQDFRKPKIKEAMRIAFDDPAAFTEFERVLGDEKAMFETMRKALQGSPTASRQAFDPAATGAMLGDVAFGPGAGAVAAQAGRGAVQKAVQAIAPQTARRQMAAEGEVLLGRNPEEMLRMLTQPARTPAQLERLLPATSTPAIQQMNQPNG